MLITKSLDSFVLKLIMCSVLFWFWMSDNRDADCINKYTKTHSHSHKLIERKQQIERLWMHNSCLPLWLSTQWLSNKILTNLRCQNSSRVNFIHLWRRVQRISNLFDKTIYSFVYSIQSIFRRIPFTRRLLFTKRMQLHWAHDYLDRRV